MKGTLRNFWPAAAILAAALAVWAISGGNFRAALSAVFPAAPAFEVNPGPEPETVFPPVVATGTVATQTAPGACSVVRVVDGDTVRVRCTGSPEEPVRLVGVDAPEVARQGNPAECGGDAATEALRLALAGGSIFLSPDPEQPDRDRYGRLLRFVATSSVLIDSAAPWEGSANVWLVRSGAATAYRDLRYGGRASFFSAEEAARAEGLGLWEFCPEA